MAVSSQTLRVGGGALSREKSSEMLIILDWSHEAYRDQDGYVNNQTQDTFVHVERPKVRVEIKED